MRRNHAVLNEENHAMETINEERKLKKKEARKRKRMRFYRFFAKLTIFALICYGVYLFDSSDVSRVRTLKVSGNHILSDEEILSALNLEPNDRIVFTHSLIKEMKGRKIEGIESIDVNVLYTKGYVSVKVEEMKPVAYQKSDVLTLWFKDGSSKVLDQSQSGLVIGLPLLVDFSADTIDNRMLDALGKMEEEAFSALSEIHLKPEAYDPLAMKLYMNNKYLVYVSIETLPMMYMYATLLSGADEGKNCIDLNEYGPDDESVIANIRACSENEY